MKRSCIARFATAAAMILNVGLALAAQTEDDLIEQSRMAWTGFLSKQFPVGTKEQVVRKLMAGKHRDLGFPKYDGGGCCLLFLVDSYHQIEFVFDPDKTLEQTPRIEPKGQWLRSPDGWLLSIPSNAERKMEARAAKLAVDYVAARTHEDRDSLRAHCERSVKKSTWDVLVNVESLEIVDRLGYVLEVTDDGKVKETRPFEHEREP